jgi:hypothetical protein
MDKNIVLHIFSFCTYRDVTKWKRASKFFNGVINDDSHEFWTNFNKNRDLITYKWEYYFMGGSNQIFQDHSKDDMYDRIGVFIKNDLASFRTNVEITEFYINTNTKRIPIYKSRDFLLHEALLYNREWRNYYYENNMNEDDPEKSEREEDYRHQIHPKIKDFFQNSSNLVYFQNSSNLVYFQNQKDLNEYEIMETWDE